MFTSQLPDTFVPRFLLEAVEEASAFYVRTPELNDLHIEVSDDLRNFHMQLAYLPEGQGRYVRDYTLDSAIIEATIWRGDFVTFNLGRLHERSLKDIAGLLEDSRSGSASRD